MCLSCSNEHKNHKIILYQEKLIDEKILRNKMNEFENVINKLKINIEGIIIKLKNIIENMNIIYNINNNILKRYENKNRNYKLLLNLNYMDKYIENEINKIKNEYDYGYNLNSLLYLYTEMTDKNEEIEIIYKPIKEEEEEENEDKKEKIRIFGETFVNNNYQKCKMIYNNEEYELKYILMI